MKIGVVILTHNRSGYLKHCLGSFIKQLDKNDQAVVIDNNSSLLESRRNKRIVFGFKYKNIQYFRSSTSSIPSGRNKGIQVLLSRVDIIAFLDDDCITVDNWICSIRIQHKMNNKTDVLQGSVRHLSKNYFYSMFTAEMYKNWLKSNKEKGIMKTFDSKNVSFKARIFQDVRNRFNENLVYSSDIEFGHRLSHQGSIIRYEPSISVFHHERDLFLHFFKQHLNIATGERDVGIGLFPVRYALHVRSIIRLIKQFIQNGDIISLLKLSIVVPSLLVVRCVNFLSLRFLFSWSKA